MCTCGTATVLGLPGLRRCCTHLRSNKVEYPPITL